VSARAPYASVIVPTHDRAATLDLTVASICAQSIADVEILLALDGATDEVRALAQRLAAADPRIIVLDLKKAPGRGSANRDLAVERARSERIFYSDDDDPWLEDHVATLGPMLDEAHVAYSPVLSLAPSGAVHSAFIDYQRADLKALLNAGKLKLTFDTHFAHRRSTYFDSGRPWAVDVDRPVYNLLTALTAPHVIWKAAAAPTALSIHGVPRRHWSATRRRDELQSWTKKLAESGPLRLQRASRLDWYFLRCLRDYPAQHEDTIEAYFSRLGFAFGDLPISAEQRAAIVAVFEVQQGRHADAATIAAALPHLLEPILGGPPPVPRTAALLISAYGADEALEIVRQAAPRNVLRRTLCAMLEGYLLSTLGDETAANAAFARVNEICFPGALGVLKKHLAAPNLG